MAISTAVDASAVARTIGIKTDFKTFTQGAVTFLPQRVALIGQGNSAAAYDTTKLRVTSAGEVGTAYGFGSPLHLAALQLLPANGDGLKSVPLTVFALEDDNSGVASTGTVTITNNVTAQRSISLRVNAANSATITMAVNDTPTQVAAALAAAVNATLELPVTAAANAGIITLTSKWKGTSANNITLGINGPVDSGATFAIGQPSGGAVNPSITPALNQFGNVWETMVLNCLDVEDSAALTEYETFNEGRWQPLVRRPLLVFTGHTFTSPNDAVAIGDARKSQRTNVLIPNPGSNNLPFESAAGVLARVALTANNNPARDYGRIAVPYVEPGIDSQQWIYTQRDQAVKGGASTIEVRNGQVNISDTVTTYHPDGIPQPGYRFVKDIVKVMNVIFNVDLIFNTTSWDGAPLVPDNQPVTNRDAKRPKDARAVLATLANNLGLQAIISDVPFTLENTLSQISETNPNRLDTLFPVKVSGNVNIQSIDLDFGFFFGTSAVIA